MDQLQELKEFTNRIMNEGNNTHQILCDYLDRNITLMGEFSKTPQSFEDAWVRLFESTKLTVKQLSKRSGNDGSGNESQGKQLHTEPTGEPV